MHLVMSQCVLRYVCFRIIFNMANQKMVRGGGRKDPPPGSPSQWGTLLEELQLGPLQPLQHQGHQAPAP